MPEQLEFVGQEPVAKLWVVGVRVDERFREVGVLQLALPDRSGEPGVLRLPGVAEHPAGEPHRNLIGGQVTGPAGSSFWEADGGEVGRGSA